MIWGKSKVNIWQSKKKLNLKLESLISAKDGLMILERWFGFKNVKMTEAAPTSQEATHKFPDAIKNISKEKEYLPE